MLNNPADEEEVERQKIVRQALSLFQAKQVISWIQPDNGLRMLMTA
jgi:LPS sulfotransferase NodH